MAAKAAAQVSQSTQIFCCPCVLIAENVFSTVATWAWVALSASHASPDHNIIVQEHRKVLNKKMLKKTKKGQPLMKHRIEQVLEKLSAL